MTKKEIDKIMASSLLSPFGQPFFKERYETDKGIKDYEDRGLYFARDSTGDQDEEWTEAATNARDGTFRVVGNYKAVAWYKEGLDEESVAATIIAAIQQYKGRPTSILYDSRRAYFLETGDELKSLLQVVIVYFTIDGVSSVRECRAKLLCEDNPKEIR